MEKEAEFQNLTPLLVHPTCVRMTGVFEGRLEEAKEESSLFNDEAQSIWLLLFMERGRACQTSRCQPIRGEDLNHMGELTYGLLLLPCIVSVNVYQ
jgi:hypothetical protein